MFNQSITQLAEKNLKSRLEDHSNSVNIVIFDPSSERLFSASSDCTVKIWSDNNANSVMTCIDTLKGHNYPITSIVYSSQDNLLFTGGLEGVVVIWQEDSQGTFRSINYISHYSSVVNKQLSPIQQMIYDHTTNYLIVASSSNLLYSHFISPYGTPKIDEKG